MTSLTKIMLIVLFTLVCISYAQASLTREVPEDGAPICPGNNVTYKCVVTAFQLAWQYTSDEGGTISYNYLRFDPVTDTVTILGPFGLRLESIVSSGSLSTITSTASTTNGLPPTEDGKVISCVGSTTQSMEISFAAPTITNASVYLDNISWNPPPCPANCTISVSGEDTDTIPCGDGNVTISVPDLCNKTVTINATDQLGKFDVVQTVSNDACTVSVTSTELSGLTTFTESLPVTTSPLASGDNTVVIAGVVVSIVLYVIVVVATILIFMCCYRKHRNESGSYNVEQVEYRAIKSEEEKEADKPFSVEFQTKKEKCHEYPITHCSVSPNADYFVTADTSMVVNLWKLGEQNEIIDCGIDIGYPEQIQKKMKSDQPHKSFPNVSGNRQLLLCLSWFVHDEQLQLMLTYDNYVIQCNIPERTCLKLYEPGRNFFPLTGFTKPSMYCAACSTSGNYFAFSFTEDFEKESLQGNVLLRIDNESGRKETILCNEEAPVVSMSFSPSSSKLVTGNVKGLIRAYDVWKPDTPLVKSVTLSGKIWEVQFGSTIEQVYSLVEGRELYYWKTYQKDAPQATTQAPTRVAEYTYTCETSPRPFQTKGGGKTDHPVTWRSKLFGLFCACKYILFNSNGQKVFCKVDSDSRCEVDLKQLGISDEPFSCIDCVQHKDKSTCVMASSTENSVTFFKLKYAGPSQEGQDDHDTQGESGGAHGPRALNGTDGMQRVPREDSKGKKPSPLDASGAPKIGGNENQGGQDDHNTQRKNGGVLVPGEEMGSNEIQGNPGADGKVKESNSHVAGEPPKTEEKNEIKKKKRDQDNHDTQGESVGTHNLEEPKETNGIQGDKGDKDHKVSPGAAGKGDNADNQLQRVDGVTLEPGNHQNGNSNSPAVPMETNKPRTKVPKEPNKPRQSSLPHDEKSNFHNPPVTKESSPKERKGEDTQETKYH